MKIYDDFTGFTFNGHHCRDFNLWRVSSGNRYDETITPSFQDRTTQVSGADEVLYWHTDYTQRPWTINCAFDSITEKQLQDIKRVYNGKVVSELIFDETPYKKYYAKLQSAPQIKYICFDETYLPSGKPRIYKGEVTFQFVAYRPYGISRYKFLDEMTGDEFHNINEWKDSIAFKNTQGDYDTFSAKSGGITTKVYNPGDIDADFIIIVPTSSVGSTWSININGSGFNKNIDFNNFTASDQYIKYNSRTQLIEGLNSSKQPTGILYNKFISSGDFFKIPATATDYTIDVNGPSTSNNATIEYDYLFY